MSAARASGRPSGLDREKLAKVLAMVGSQHDGERANAAGLADRMVRAAGLTWDQVLTAAGTSRAASGGTAEWQSGFSAGLAAAAKAGQYSSGDHSDGPCEGNHQYDEDRRWNEFEAWRPDLAEWISKKADRGQEFAKSLR